MSVMTSGCKFLSGGGN